MGKSGFNNNGGMLPPFQPREAGMHPKVVPSPTQLAPKETVMSIPMIRTNLRILAGALMLGVVATGASANGTAEQRAACTPDVFRLCSSEIPNVDRIIACMKTKQNSLSPQCKAALRVSKR
jgi:hypothetical protein